MKLKTLPVLSLAAGLSLAQSAASAEWERGAGVSVSSYYSDNICLASRDEEGDYVATVTPDVRLNGTGARTRVALNARVEFNTIDQVDADCPGGAQGGSF